jgi:hypothetical protein
MKMPNEVAWALKKAKVRRYYHIISYSIWQHDVLITICFILRKDVSLLPCSTISDKNFLANTQAYGKYVITLPRHVRGCNVITRLYPVLREKTTGRYNSRSRAKRTYIHFLILMNQRNTDTDTDIGNDNYWVCCYLQITIYSTVGKK